MRPIALACLLTLLRGSVFASNFTSSAKATTAADFLTLGAGARAASMGDAYTAVADEATAVYWNPAALTRVPSKSAAFMHAAYVDSSFFDYAAYAQNLGGYGAVGGSVQYLSAGAITETDATGTEIGNFTPNDLAVSLAYAYKLRDIGSFTALNGFSAGLSAKYIQSQILATARTEAADIGVLSPAYLDGKLRFAFTASNLGGRLKYERESEDLPMVFKVGSSYSITERWLAGLDAAFPRSNNPYAALGTEYRLPVSPSLSVAGRLGFNSKTIGDVTGFTGVALGVGVSLHQLADLSFDYAFLPLGGLGLTHRISISLKF